jgi:predicted dehydrogenase/threonine dehydrogenase-like Zn-dependent dehydrogenase
MKQILLKKGLICTADVVAPLAEKDVILVRTMFSCISAGTEMSGVQSSGKTIVQKILDKPELALRGLRMAQERGVKETLDTIKGKYDTGSPMGYSASGEVVKSGSPLFSAGDRVACMGVSYANHAGYLAVPVNLAAKLPDEVNFEQGATAALGCIAMQGVRRAAVALGEFVVVMGMGIIGQLVARFAAASGATVIATDVDKRRLNIAAKNGVSYALDAKDDVVSIVNNITGGHGADSVIITAATESSEIISQAFKMCRRRGRVVLVGVAGMNLKREDMYTKELDFSIATSYGPGRYDTSYEEGGQDYPYGYVRFTEKRNLESYLRLLAEKRVVIDDIIEAVYPAEDADMAYNALRAGENRPLIVLLRYAEQKAAPVRVIELKRKFTVPGSAIRVALCGAGGFAKGIHLPNMRKMPDKYTLYAVQSRTGSNAQAVAAQYGAKYAATDYDQIIADPDIDLVMICARHNLHADMAIKALRVGKAVFVEKPMALTASELDAVVAAVKESGSPYLVGFNRRFSKYARAVKNNITNRKNPLLVFYRMNAGFLPPEHWTQGSEGGGRIIGEGCHILDLFTFFTESRAKSVSVTQLSPRTDHILRTDNTVITVKYEDGSVCTLLYTGQGHKDYGKEFCEVYCDGAVYTIDDYTVLRSYGARLPVLETKTSEKGQFEELEAFYDAIKNGDGYPIPLWQLEQATRLSFMGQE